jgi:hypothetical protein
MREKADILVLGTGSFAARILLDLAATASAPTRIVIAGRNSDRVGWLETAGRARAHMFARPAHVKGRIADPSSEAEMGELLAETEPAAILQAASLQTSAVIAAKGNAWSALVAAGGLSASAVFQTVISARVARAALAAAPGAHLVNACFPDVVNGLVKAMGLPVTCGIGNVQILAHAFGGVLASEGPGEHDLRLLCHYQSLAPWRRHPAERSGPTARVWIDAAPVGDIYGRFAGVRLTPEPVIDISGAAGVPLLLALAHGAAWRGHAPGPDGRPGGYPVRLAHGRLTLDLPPGVGEAEAVAWNEAHEAASGLVVGANGFAHYTGTLRDRLAAESPELAKGFHVRDLETVHVAMRELRQTLLARVV